MLDALIQLAMFSAKAFIIMAIILIVLFTFFALIARGKLKTKGQLHIVNLNGKYAETTETLLTEIYTKKQFKKFLKDKKTEEKAKEKKEEKLNHVYVLNFHGDVKASAVDTLRQEVTAVLNIVKPHDEVIVKVESAGGVVHGYGLAAAQLMRFRARNISLTVTVDKVAASGGYMMACIANKILAAPFAIVGSIGVIVQLPNFHKVLKDKHIDFEQHTAGEFKRTITLFGENTDEGREKLQHEIEDIHGLFKTLIKDHRPDIDLKQVATGEHWMGQQALSLKLVDEIKTSDDYILERSKHAKVYEIYYEVKKPLIAKLLGSAQMLRMKWLGV